MDDTTAEFVKWMDTSAPPGYCKRKCGTKAEGTLCYECLQVVGKEVLRSFTEGPMRPLGEQGLAALDALAQEAEAVIPGRFRCVLGSGGNVCTAIMAEDESGGRVFVTDTLPDWALAEKVAPSDHLPVLHYFAALEPAVIRRLISRIRTLERQVDELEAELEDHDFCAGQWHEMLQEEHERRTQLEDKLTAIHDLLAEEGTR